MHSCGVYVYFSHTSPPPHVADCIQAAGRARAQAGVSLYFHMYTAFYSQIDIRRLIIHRNAPCRWKEYAIDWSMAKHKETAV